MQLAVTDAEAIVTDFAPAWGVAGTVVVLALALSLEGLSPEQRADATAKLEDAKRSLVEVELGKRVKPSVDRSLSAKLRPAL